MPIAVVIDNPHGTQEIYDKVRAHLGMEGPAGGIVHLAGPSPKGGWRVIEVWESKEDAMRFRKERLEPAWQAVEMPGPPPEPEFWELHNVMK